MNKDRQKSHTGGERIQLHLYNRLRVIHQMVANQRFPTARSLAETLEVNVRTVRRYIAFMRDSFGAPIKFDTKKKGFCYTHPNWEMPLVPLTEGELLAFFIASVALQGTGSTYEEERLRRAVAKIAGSLPEAVSVSLGYLFENTSFQPPPHVLVAGQTLDVLHKAIGEREIVKFDYVSTTSGETKNRRVEPLLLHNHEGTWYVVAFDYLKGNILVFHTARIGNLETTGDYFDERKEFRKEEYFGTSFGMYRGGAPVEVEIIFDEYQSHWMRERNFFHPQEKREELPDGKLKLLFTVGENGLEAVARFCLQYAGNFVAAKPEKLREIIIQKLKNSLEQHNGEKN
ncbi:MAG: helix-turn-helix transcriptional regulator [Pyrinomonadaceae bacterium]